MKKFWKWATNATAAQGPQRTLSIEGYIAEESWFEDDVTPRQFKEELYAGLKTPDDIVVAISSPGGDCFAAAKIYDMLKEYPGRVTVHIHALAASAASVVAMAGDEVLMSPTAVCMIHNPATLAIGEVSDFEAAIDLLSEVKESIINAYALKSGQPRNKLAKMMDRETWMSANKAIELGFADGLLYEMDIMLEPEAVRNTACGFLFDRLTVTNALISKLPKRERQPEPEPEAATDAAPESPPDLVLSEQPALSAIIPMNQLEKRLSLLRH